MWRVGALLLSLSLLGVGGMNADRTAEMDGDIHTEFLQWATRHKRPYVSGDLDQWREYWHRFEIWMDNRRYVEEQNKLNTSHRLGMNSNADLTHEEFKARYLGFDAQAALEARMAREQTAAETGAVDGEEMLANLEAPEFVDWRGKGAVTYVKDQAQCGSCWSFSTTGSVEGINAIVTGDLEVLSEQELIDCDTKRADNGCNGGNMDTAFKFVMDNGGLDTEEDYRYHGQQGKCDVTRENRHVVTIDGYKDVPRGNQVALKQAVARQPVSAAVDASSKDWQLYSQGVFQGKCSTRIDHAILIVGYGQDMQGQEYWLIKNSWSPQWGEEGYIRLPRSEGRGDGKCGIAVMASYPEKSGPNPPRPPPSPRSLPSPPPPGSPPGPSPDEQRCDSYTTATCPADSTCCCESWFAFICTEWACCGIPNATCCADHQHCCPEEFPKCGVGHCYKDSSDQYFGEISSIPWIEKVPARRRQIFSRAWPQ